MQTIVHTAATAVFPLAMAYAAFSDLRSFRIPNWVPVAIFLCFVPAALAAGWDGGAVLTQLAAGAAVLAVGLIPSVRRVIGGGDVKLLAAASVWVGWHGLPAYLLAVAVFGGVLALVLLVFRRVTLPAALASAAWLKRLHSKTEGVPYGIAIALAAIFLFPDLLVVAGPG